MIFRYFIVGIVNTIFGYSVGILNFYLLEKIIGILLVGILNNLISITFSFIMHKKFTFKTKKNIWLSEYIKSYFVYGIGIIVNIFTLWYCLKILSLNIYASQFFAVLLVTIFSYFGNKKFVYKV